MVEGTSLVAASTVLRIHLVNGIRDWSQLRVFVLPGTTDMRKQINGLAALVRDQLGHDPLDGSLYLFSGPDRNRLKILYWDRKGFCLWPKDAGEVRRISGEQLAMLLDGIDFWRAHQDRQYTNL